MRAGYAICGLAVAGLAACVPAASTVSSSPSGTVAPSVWAPEYKVERKTDEFTNVRETSITFYDALRLRGALLACTNMAGDKPVVVYLSVHKTVRGADSALYLRAAYLGADWLFLSEEASMIVLIDGDVTTPKLEGRPARDVRSGPGGTTVVEGQLYAVTPEYLALVARGGTVKVRLNGERGKCDFAVPPESLDLLGRFAREELGIKP